MKKSHIFIIITMILLVLGFGIYFYNSKKQKISNNNETNNYSYNSTRISSNNQSNNNSESINTSSENSNSQENKNETSNQQSNNEQEHNNTKTETQTQISDFTTKIYTKDKDRQKNISITCSSLNDTIVNNGETFSFCNTVGKATTSKGYEKADVYKDGEVIQALGGGNCQVSSTLYNAVLEVANLNVTERHEHSNSVPYVAKGKDAAVAYGSYDFKFINNTGSKIKISASCDKNFVYIKIFKIS